MLLLLIQTVIGIAAIATLRMGWHVLIAHRQEQYRQTLDTVLLSIRVSRQNERQPIVAEQMFAVLHGALHHISFWQHIQGVQPDSFSFEIAHVDGMIKFYTHVPKHLQDFVENQIYAQYPDVEIEEVPDYAYDAPAMLISARRKEEGTTSLSPAPVGTGHELSLPTSAQHTESVHSDPIDYFTHASGAELCLNTVDIFPIKRYAQFEDKLSQTTIDPLSSLTSVLAKMPHPNDRAMIQIVAQPISEAWRSKAARCARILGKGIFMNIGKLQTWYARAFMTRKSWPKWVFFPIYWIMWFQGLMSGSKVKLSGASNGDVLASESSDKHAKEGAGAASMDKATKLPFDVSIRVIYVPTLHTPSASTIKVREMCGAFKQFSQPHINGFKVRETGGPEILARYRLRAIHEPFVLNTEELATVFHLPNLEVKTPNIYWITNKKLEPPVDLPTPQREVNLTVLGKSNYRGLEKVFGIRQEDRRRHIYIIGKTGMGKSTLLENMIISDINDGKGVAVVDPHGDLAEHILDHIPSHRTNDVVVFDPSDRDHPVAFNMLENIDPTMNSVVASGLVGIFKKLYAESWGPRLEHILRNTILSLLEYPGTTMLGIPRMLADEAFRKRVVRKISDPIVKKFWTDEFEPMQEKQRVEAISPIQNKVGQFLSSSIIRNIVGQPKSMVNLRYAMDNRKIFVCNLSKGKIGEDNSSLLGSMMITKFQLDAMSRSNIPEKDRVDFYLYVDEFQNFATDSFATILSEARKYRLNLTMANQYIAQMSDEVKDAVFGNVGTMMTFQVGYDDAEYISKQFSEVVLPNDLVQLPKHNLYTKLLVDGMPTTPFSAGTMAPISANGAIEGRRDKVFKISRERYSKPREQVEDKITRWSSAGDDSDDDTKQIKSTPTQKPLPEPKKQIVDDDDEDDMPKKVIEAEVVEEEGRAEKEHVVVQNPFIPLSKEGQGKISSPPPATPEQPPKAPTPALHIPKPQAKAPAPKPQPTLPPTDDELTGDIVNIIQQESKKLNSHTLLPPHPSQPQKTVPQPDRRQGEDRRTPKQPDRRPLPQASAPRTPLAPTPQRHTPERHRAPSPSPRPPAPVPQQPLQQPIAVTPGVTATPGVKHAADQLPAASHVTTRQTPPQPNPQPAPPPQLAQPSAPPQPPSPAPTPAPQPQLTPQQYQMAVTYLQHYEIQYRMPRDQAWHAAVTAVLQQTGGMR